MKKLPIVTFIVCLLMAYHIVNAQGIPEKATDISPLLTGESIPEIELKKINGETIALKNITRSKPTVLIFYRGGWCPYCNLHLSELQRIEKDILMLGYQIVAVSPDSGENLKASMDKHKLNYQLLSDSDMKAAQAFGIAYAVPETSKARLSDSSGRKNPGLLPVPSVFVLDQQGEILFEYINPDYKKRVKSGLLLAVLKELQK